MTASILLQLIGELREKYSQKFQIMVHHDDNIGGKHLSSM
jgi:hypothetical protein